jgi:hypothetical protein
MRKAVMAIDLNSWHHTGPSERRDGAAGHGGHGDRDLMGYRVRNGRVVHDQGRVHRFCQAVKEQFIPVGEAELGDLPVRGGAVHAVYAKRAKRIATSPPSAKAIAGSDRPTSCA